jgi:tetratricopeptide (TPR) repeat protein
VPLRGTALLAVAIAALALPARAQVTAPKLVDEGEEQPEEKEPQKEPPREPPRAAPAAPAPAAAAPSPTQAPSLPATSSSGTLALPPPPPPPAPTADLARRILPVQTTQAQLMALWVDHRTAVREADPARAERSAAALLAARRELGIENLFGMAAAELRESRRALAGNGSARAVAHAELAVQLAPDLADAHLGLARARFSHSPGNVGPVVSALGDALAAGMRDPQTSRAFIADVLGAGLAAVFAAAIAVVVVLMLRHLRRFLHDLQHVPLVGAAGVQASFLALVLLASPILFGAGAFAVAALAALVSFAYQSRRERVVTAVAIAALAALPWVAGQGARATWWTGTLAEEVDRLERGAPADAEVDALAAKAASASDPAPLYAALGRHFKREGKLPEARRWYAAATEADPRAPELLVNDGNVLLLQGDLEGAKAAYLAATDRAAGDLTVLAAAHYNLSKLYLRSSDMEKSAASREKAEREDEAFLRKYGSDDDFSANRYVVDVPVKAARLDAMARASADGDAVRMWAESRVAGALPGRLLAPITGLVLGLLGLLALAARRLKPSHACERCGGAACRRCDRNAGAMCGACINVFTRRGVVDARDRLRKESEVRRHERLSRFSTRALALVGGGVGQVWSGRPVLGALLIAGIAFLVTVAALWRGLLPPPLPTPYVLALKLGVVVPLGAALWLVAVRDAFRRTE